MAVTQKEILSIKPGTFKVFKVEKPSGIKSAMGMCTYIKNMREIPEKVERYAFSSEYKNLLVTIMAVKKEVTV